MSRSTERELESSTGGEDGEGCGCGCLSSGVVLFVSLALSLLKANVGVGASVRIPFTESNITLAGSVGHKDLSKDTLPYYIEDGVGDNKNFINESSSLTIGPAQGTEMFVVGKQPESPWFDMHIDIDTK